MRDVAKRRKHQVIVGVILAAAGTSGLAGAALAQTETSSSETPEPTHSLSPQGQEEQAAYAALDDWLAQWDAQKESEAASAPPLEDARPSFSPDPWEDSLAGGAAGNFLYPEKHGYAFESSWTHSDGAHYWGVYAGTREDSEDGVLLVQRIDPETMRSTFIRVDTDVEGGLTITSADGTTLALVSDSGVEFSFDVSSLASNDFPSIDHVTSATEIPW